MSAIRTVIVAPVISAMLALFGLTANAADQSEAAAAGEASLVVYRADESVRTQRLRIAVRVDGEQMGRLRSDDAIATSHPAGTYEISTGIHGAETIEIDLKPGMVHYVRIDPRERTQRLSVSVTEVEEQVAQVERPELNSAI